MSLPLATFNGYKGLLIFNQKHVFSDYLLVLRTIKMEIFFKTKVKCFFLPIQLGCILKLHSIMGPLQKHKNKEMPQSLEVSKVHKVMIINCLKLVILCVFAPLWQNYNFQR